MYELPVVQGKALSSRSGPASWILGNWQTNMIVLMLSGQPYNMSVPGDVANIGNTVSWWNYARPNLVGKAKPAHPSRYEWFDPSAFALPSFSYGNSPKNFALASRYRCGLRSSRAFLLGNQPTSHSARKRSTSSTFRTTVSPTVTMATQPSGRSPATSRPHANCNWDCIFNINQRKQTSRWEDFVLHIKAEWATVCIPPFHVSRSTSSASIATTRIEDEDEDKAGASIKLRGQPRVWIQLPFALGIVMPREEPNHVSNRNPQNKLNW